jgi:hypothetical protein
MASADPKTTITHGDRDLVSSGSFITLGPGETAIDLSFLDDHLRLVIEFSGTEREYSKQEIEASYPGEATLKLHFKNYNNPLGTHQKAPQELGTIAGRRFWLVYRVVALQGSESKHFTYSIYVAREPASGKA